MDEEVRIKESTWSKVYRVLDSWPSMFVILTPLAVLSAITANTLSGSGAAYYVIYAWSFLMMIYTILWGLAGNLIGVLGVLFVLVPSITIDYIVVDVESVEPAVIKSVDIDSRLFNTRYRLDTGKDVYYVAEDEFSQGATVYLELRTSTDGLVNRTYICKEKDSWCIRTIER